MNQLSTDALASQIRRTVLEELHTRLEQGCASPEVLQVTRRCLLEHGPSTAEADEQKLLESVYELYVKRLQEALQADRPSAVVLGEAHKFLKSQHGMAGAPKPTALFAVELGDLPFQ
jgi:hypothetical protein